MSSDIKKYYEEYEKFFKKKKLSSNSNRVSGKQENIKTNKYNKTCQKENINNNNNVIPFSYRIIAKNEEQINPDSNINILEKKYGYVKFSKILSPKKNISIGEKVFYKKDGRPEKFSLFNEDDLGLNKYDNKINIMSAEEDYDSDDMIIMDGTQKAQSDLFEAVEIVKKNGYKDIYNYQKYYKNNLSMINQ